MRDSYGRIRPDFEAWEKLGYKLAEIHEDTYGLENIDSTTMYFTLIYACYDEDTIKEYGKPVYQKEEFEFPDSKLVEFTPEELKQIEKDIKNWEEETRK